MDNGGGDGGCGFGSDAAEVTDVHEAGAGEVGDVVGEREVRIKRMLLLKCCSAKTPLNPQA